MFLKTTKEIIKPKLAVLLEEAKNAELCRDIEESRRIFSSFWQDIETDPDVSDFEAVVQAELLRLCGFFLSITDVLKAKPITNCAERIY